MKRRTPKYGELRRSWPREERKARKVEDLVPQPETETQAQPASHATRNILILAGLLIVLGLLIRKPAIAVVKNIMDSAQVKKILAQFGGKSFTEAPAEARPDSLTAAYPRLSTVRGTSPLSAKEIVDTVPLKYLWGVEEYYQMPAAQATASSVVSIAKDPAEFVQVVKQAAINAASQLGFADPKIVVAQAALEGGWGKSAIGGTNLFGHVATAKWANASPQNRFSFERTYEYRTQPDGSKKKEQTVRPFRVYPNLDSALTAHFSMIKNNFGMDFSKVKSVTDYVDTLFKDPKKQYATAGKESYLADMKSIYARVEQHWNP